MLPKEKAGHAPSQVAQGTWRFPLHSLQAGAVAFCAQGSTSVSMRSICKRVTTALRGKRPHPAHAHSSTDDRRDKRRAAEDGGSTQRKRAYHGTYHDGSASRWRHLRCAGRPSARRRGALGCGPLRTGGTLVRRLRSGRAPRRGSMGGRSLHSVAGMVAYTAYSSRGQRLADRTERKAPPRRAEAKRR